VFRAPVAKKVQTSKQLTAPLEAERKTIPAAIRREVDAEAGYRCGNPRCQTLVAVEHHHIEYVSEGGTNEAWNLLPLCPTCHARHHSGEITVEAVRVWKGLLVTLNNAFDRQGRDLLLFLWHTQKQTLWYSGDGALQFSGLIAAGLVSLRSDPLYTTTPPSTISYGGMPMTDMGSIHEVGLKVEINLTEKGKLLIAAWLNGDESEFKAALATASPPHRRLHDPHPSHPHPRRSAHNVNRQPSPLYHLQHALQFRAPVPHDHRRVRCIHQNTRRQPF
jgi:hypothetical protein